MIDAAYWSRTLACFLAYGHEVRLMVLASIAPQLPAELVL